MARKKKNLNSPSKDQPHGGYVEFATRHLRDRLDLVRKVVPRRASRRDCACYHFEVKPDGTATLGATDLENRLLLKLAVTRYTGIGKVMVEAHALDAMIGAFPEDRVRIHLDDVKLVGVEGLTAKLKVPGHDPAKEMRTQIEGSTTTSGWIVRGSELATAIESTRYATDDKATRYALNGVAIVFPEGDAGDAEFVGCDGRRLALYRVPVRAHRRPERVWRPENTGVVAPSTFYPIVPCKVLGLVVKLAREAGEGSVAVSVVPGAVKDLEKKVFGPGAVQIATKDAVLTTQVPEGRFPRFRDVIPNIQPTAWFKLNDATKLRDLLALATAGTDSESRGVEMVTAGGCLMIWTESETKGKSQLSLILDESEGKATFTVDALFLRQFFDAAGNESMEARYFDKKSPLLFKAGPKLDFVLMPLSKDEKPAPRPQAEQVEREPEPEGDEPEGDGDVPVESKPEPEPVGPVGETPDAHKGNGKAKPSRNGRHK